MSALGQYQLLGSLTSRRLVSARSGRSNLESVWETQAVSDSLSRVGYIDLLCIALENNYTTYNVLF